MNRLKKFLCNMDPGLAAMNTITLAMIGFLIFSMGIKHVAIMFGIFIVAGTLFVLVGIGIYKAITYAQSKCKE